MRKKSFFSSRKGISNSSETNDSVVIKVRRNNQVAYLKALAEGDLQSLDQCELLLEDEFDQYLLQIAENLKRLKKEILAFNNAEKSEDYAEVKNSQFYSGYFKEILEFFEQSFYKQNNDEQIEKTTNALNLLRNGVIPDKIDMIINDDHIELTTAMNGLIESFASLNELNNGLKRMSQNDYTKPIEGEYNGIYADFKDSISRIFVSNSWIINAFKHLAVGDVREDLETMKILVTQTAENDEFIPSIIKAMSNIILLLTETQDMLEAAINGDLHYRIDISKFEGEYVKIVSGFNQCIDTITEPLKEASSVLSGLSQGNLETHMTGSYSGDNGKIKTDLNVTIDFLKKYIQEITNVLQRIGAGDLTTKIDGEFSGDFAAIKIALTEITIGLNRIISEIGKSAEMVEVGAKQISLASQDLAEGSSKQASSVEELSASMEEISEKTKRSADNASQVNLLTKTMYERANAGNNLMMELVGAIGDINESSKSISKIIKVIDDIAFQTNILALNAAVEAARAGEHGKGFSVVAEEVRVLASKSADAARQTNELIDQSVERAKVGTSMADNTAIRLKEMLEQIEKTTELVDAIAVSSVEQVTEFDEIRKGIEEVSSVVQRNAATAQESAASSQELFAQSNLLKKAVEQFTLFKDIK